MYKTRYNNRRSKLEIPKNREAEKSKKNREQRRKGEEEEVEAGGETVIDQMEVARDMEVTGDVVVSGYDDKNWWFLAFFFLFRFYVTIFFFLKILVQNLFGKKILRMFLILLEGVPFFFKGKQIKKFKLLYIIFF